jgi:hypothetical protein
MKIRHLITAASAAVLLSPFAMAQEPAAAPTGSDESCATLQTKIDADIATAQSSSAAQVQSLRDEGAKLCAEGRTEEGIAKLKEALSHLSAPTPEPAAPTP